MKNRGQIKTKKLKISSFQLSKKRRGQVKIQQMAFMLIAVTLFFVLVGMFFLTIQISNLRETATLLEERNALLLVTKLANSPEFSCGEVFNAVANCIDADKAMALKNNIGKYTDFWGASGIQIVRIYPAGNKVECTLGNYPDCNVIKVYGEIIAEHSNFVSLCRVDSVDGEDYDKCELAELMVSYGRESP